MVIDENGLVALLKKRHKYGYDVVMSAGSIVLKTEDWMVETKFGLLPRKVLGLLAEHMGLLPAAGEALHVVRDEENQGIVPAVALGEIAEWKRTDHGTEAWAAPLTFKGQQIYQARDLRMVGVSMGLLRMVDEFERAKAFALDGNRIMWSSEGQTVIVSAYHPYKGKEADWWTRLEDVDWRADADEE